MKFKITVKSPFIIKDNEHISSFEIFLDKNGKCKILNLENLKLDKAEIKIIKELISNSLDPFNSRIDFYRYNELQKEYNRISKNNKIFYENDIENLISGTYKPKNEISMPISNISLEGGNSIIPYIPGSSIKGEIRKSMLYSYLSNNVRVKEDVKKCISRFKPIDKKFNQNMKDCFNKLFHYSDNKPMFQNYMRYDPAIDILRFLEVSDFIPKNFSLSLREMRRVNSSGKNVGKGIPVQAIMIESGEFIGDIKLNIPKGEKSKEFIRSFNQILGNNYSDENQILLDIIEKMKWQEKDNKEGVIFYLGFGKGAEKTSIASIDPEFKSIYENAMKGYKGRPSGRWPPSTFFVLDDKKRPGRLLIEAI